MHIDYDGAYHTIKYLDELDLSDLNNPESTILYTVGVLLQYVNLSIYNILGQKVITLLFQ